MAGFGAYRLRWGEREIEVAPAGFVVGRAAGCDLRLEAGMVSRRHARFRETGEGLLLEDLGSRNGVFVNQTRIEGPTVVHHGDRIEIGLQALDVIEEQQLRRPEHLSTLPPSKPPWHLPDTLGDEPETQVAQLAVLSPREREVFELIARGYTQKEMAELLHVSVKTIETHRARISDKTGCRTRAEMVAWAIAAGLLCGERRAGS